MDIWVPLVFLIFLPASFTEAVCRKPTVQRAGFDYLEVCCYMSSYWVGRPTFERERRKREIASGSQYESSGEGVDPDDVDVIPEVEPVEDATTEETTTESTTTTEAATEPPTTTEYLGPEILRVEPIQGWSSLADLSDVPNELKYCDSNFCSVHEGTSVIKLTKDNGFEPFEWYVICVRTDELADCPAYCSLVRACGGCEECEGKHAFMTASMRIIFPRDNQYDELVDKLAVPLKIDFSHYGANRGSRLMPMQAQVSIAGWEKKKFKRCEKYANGWVSASTTAERIPFCEPDIKIKDSIVSPEEGSSYADYVDLYRKEQIHIYSIKWTIDNRWMQSAVEAVINTSAVLDSHLLMTANTESFLMKGPNGGLSRQESQWNQTYPIPTNQVGVFSAESHNKAASEICGVIQTGSSGSWRLRPPGNSGLLLLWNIVVMTLTCAFYSK